MKMVSITPLLIASMMATVTVTQAWVSAPQTTTTKLTAVALQATTTTTTSRSQHINAAESADNNDSARRTLLVGSALASASLLFSAPALAAEDNPPAYLQEYSDFTESPSGGWRYRDVKDGSGTVAAKKGDRVVFDWSGYTIGYFGRPFQAKGGPVGGAFDKDLDLSRTVIGSGQVVKGLEEALQDMKAGGVRQVVIPYSKELSYPPDDLTHERVGPKPSTFSGQRALNFVLENPRLDRTLLFNVKLVRVDKSDGKGGFIRGDR
mmetsp:Transcript_23166/g.38312  ORF Transcript_23166/g.38312 Transcript_23166/m.38312 type:complete len:264 (+) Transcript_23166:83-874(+)|eukprot:CAMPEP_0119005924 /NCGR_PEP_ID=MMETSP1176-20130426/2011_1 /TAXON_ID=265551 /ORGANISM="Synedropsis recta cf, Strain CCMP1620" /LENGTH=263 /DNA_ID=CAMNT_0006957783 /DNA_START=83 /DNA_END=874 /DNA_ORIENTATION=+